MLKLIQVARNSENPQRHIIFLHGLGGHAYKTWQSSNVNNSTFWPVWLADEIADVAIWTVSYSAPPSNWLGTAIPLQHRAVSVLAMLTSDERLQQGSIAFVGHSLGGLLIKQVLREANDQRSRQVAVERLLNQVQAAVFYGTPHTGARLANFADRLRLLVWPSVATHDLMLFDSNLRSLNTWYRNWSEHIEHRVYYETHGTSIGMVVDPSSADAGLVCANPIPIDADHFGICKPIDCADQRYVLTREFLKNDVFQTPSINSSDTEVVIESRPELTSTHPSILLPAFVRVCLASIVVFVLYQGIDNFNISYENANATTSSVTVTGPGSVGIETMSGGEIKIGSDAVPVTEDNIPVQESQQ